MEILKIYLGIINIATFLIYYVDKKRAKGHKWRISENFLLGCSFVGGSLGAILSMYINHHKSKKLKFLILNPLFLIVQIYLINKYGKLL